MRNRRAVLLTTLLTLFGSTLGNYLCGCPSGNCLPPPNPYEAISAALAIPLPLPPPPALPQLPPPECVIDGCGPPPTPLEVIQAPPVVVPGPATPVIPLPEPVLPAPQVVAQKCIVCKVVQKPQVYQRLIQVPILARFLKKGFAPVLENIAYTATPQCGQPPPPPLPPPCAPPLPPLPPPCAPLPPPCAPPLPPPCAPPLPPPLPPLCGCFYK